MNIDNKTLLKLAADLRLCGIVLLGIAGTAGLNAMLSTQIVLDIGIIGAMFGGVAGSIATWVVSNPNNIPVQPLTPL